VLTQLAQIWLRGMQDRLLVRSVVLQAEASLPMQSVSPAAADWVPKPRGGLCLQVSATAEVAEP
jgi:hypothetical protein